VKVLEIVDVAIVIVVVVLVAVEYFKAKEYFFVVMFVEV